MTAKIKLNAASGGGSFSLQAPSSSANNRVMTLPDSADGTVLTTTNPKAGNIIQVVTNTTRDSAGSVSLSVSRTYYDIPNQNVTITPTSNTSKMLISFQQLGEFTATPNGYNFVLERSISGGSTTLIQGDIGSDTNKSAVFTSPLITYHGDDNDTTIEVAHGSNYLDSPATASAVTYKVKVRKHEAGTGTYYYNRTILDNNANHSERGLSWITVMEVAA